MEREATNFFIPTSISTQIENTIRFSLQMQAACLIKGPAGCGKTTALRRWAETDAQAIYIVASASDRTIKCMYEKVSIACGWDFGRCQHRHLREILFSRMPDFVECGYYLIFDEVQNLDLNALRGLLDFNDLFNLPLVLAGNPETLKKSRAHGAAFDQIESRIWKQTTIRGAEPKDIEAFGVQFNVEFEAYPSLIKFGSENSIRRIVQLLATAREATGNVGQIKLSHLQDALIYQTGNSRAQLSNPAQQSSL